MSTSVECSLTKNSTPKAQYPSHCSNASYVENADPSNAAKSTIPLNECIKDTYHKYGSNSEIEPQVGMTFNSEDEAYNFYNAYAKKKGFSVRKDHISRRSDGRIRYRHYVCSNEGSRKEQCSTISRRSRPIERTNCLARIEFKVNNDNIWIVNKFVDEHNHPLARPNNSHMLRSHRKKLPVQRAACSKSDVCSVAKDNQPNDFQEDTHLIADSGLISRNHCRSLSTKRTRDLENGDAQFLLDFLKVKQSEDPLFFYAVQLDEEERLTNCFWADMQSIIDYTYFGDVVLFDSSYRTSSCDLPFAPFIGINHHKQITVFGAAILLDESIESFIWLFRTFLLAMSGKQPKAIFTDRCTVISEAINMVLPNTSHKFCLWHLLQSAYVNLPYSDINFQKEFQNCIYHEGSEDDFLNCWNTLISQFGLATNPWFEGLYAVREKWAVAYDNGTFSASMMTKKWAEKVENLFKYHFDRKMPLTKFLMQYLKALVHLREKEILEDYETLQTKPTLFVEVPVLTEAAEHYTRTVYVDFEEAYKSQLACTCEHIGPNQTVYIFRVSNAQKQCTGLVEFDPSSATVTCSCKRFESMGILCMHALRVLNNNNILCLPSHYILKRWTKRAKDGEGSSGCLAIFGSGGQASLRFRYRRVCHKAIALSLKSSVSKDALDILENAVDKIIIKMENCSLS